MVLGDSIFVANAGDSPCVISRAGKAVAGSEDHKPQQDREKDRIVKAGGFVNGVGRVNGNLNLSRSLGDLKYKGDKNLPPAEQIITALPDVREFKRTPEDEFMILACDGIWDCMSNQDAVDFVRGKLAGGEPLASITEAMCDQCLSEDPKTTAGIGGDNMTALIVKFNT